jgi:hypothetical protein
MKVLMQGWNFSRALRLTAALAILVQGLILKEASAFMIGAVFSGMALANIGCCGTNNCLVNTCSSENKQGNK